MSTAFRRINGRVVPIRDNGSLTTKQAKKQGMVGAAEAGAGAAGGVAAGMYAAKQVRKASKDMKEASDIYKHARRMFKVESAIFGNRNSFARMRRTQQIAKSVALKKGATAIFRARTPFLAAAGIVSGGFISSGFEKIRGAIKKEKPKSTIPSKITPEILGGAVVVGSYYHHLPVGSITKVAMNTAARLKGKGSPFKATWWK